MLPWQSRGEKQGRPDFLSELQPEIELSFFFRIALVGGNRVHLTFSSFLRNESCPCRGMDVILYNLQFMRNKRPFLTTNPQF